MVPLHSHESSNSPRGNVEVVAFSCDLSTMGWERAGWIATAAAERGPGRQSGQQEYKKIGRDGGGGSGWLHLLRAMAAGQIQLPSKHAGLVRRSHTCASARAPRVEVTALTCAVCLLLLHRWFYFLPHPGFLRDTKRCVALLRYRRDRLLRHRQYCREKKHPSGAVACGLVPPARRERRPLVALL